MAASFERGHLQLRTREALPYGLAIFDERVGVGGYDDETGTLRVFVDTDTDGARRWAEGVYEMYRQASEPVSVAGESNDAPNGSNDAPDESNGAPDESNDTGTATSAQSDGATAPDTSADSSG
ncbi:hypothetical protein C499_04466 [Halogeometricum borinquense DSM 11551]|uniref:Methanogenesis regulatory protein FilR1 middle domain-containing protein n=2 Tax=Halogeometricum borinquense TaxID=60847 RepID=E4NSZ0_HALBP|nr:hypothetical protein [Halogeometricum borinquense]ADQ66983.1 hypothetical protein Hbor_14020 [Halogeometricum borinquense DSM 11551]ELY29774.1 hypothetical protein C499_04466 [Halogeometricum borinquense DSM 11551]RYJ14034.1 hypothetical protein ELS19_08680 [Halogeometricum borinquense]